MPAVESGKRPPENTVGRHSGRRHVLLHRGCDRIDQMDRETQVIGTRGTRFHSHPKHRFALYLTRHFCVYERLHMYKLEIITAFQQDTDDTL